MVPVASYLPGTSSCLGSCAMQKAVNEEAKGDGISVQTDSKITQKATLSDITQSEQYCRANYHGALQEYFRKFHPNAQLRCENTRDSTGKEFKSTCKVNEVLGVGRARTKKQAIQLAALDVIFKLGLAPPVEKSARRFPRNEMDWGTVAIAPISKNDQYKRDNFRGALLEYLRKLGREVNVVFETAPQSTGQFVSTCSFDGNVGTGRARTKKRAIQLAAFDLICKLKLLPSHEVERQRERQKKQNRTWNFGTQISPNMLNCQRTPLIVPTEQCRNTDLLKVLELHFKKLGREVALVFNTTAKTNKSFISTCVIDGVRGTGRAGGKRQAIQLAALDLIVKLKVPLQENVKRMQVCKRESRKRRKVWRSAGLLYILPSAKAKHLAKNFGVKKQTKTGYRCLLPVPLSILLAGGHERCKPFRCNPELCEIRSWMIENIRKEILAEFQFNTIAGGFPCRFFTKLSQKKLLAQLNAVRLTHSAMCGLETHRNSSRSRGSRIVNMSFTGWGKREERDKDSMETARRETLEECGIDIEKVSWSVKLRRISFGEPLYIFIDMDKA